MKTSIYNQHYEHTQWLNKLAFYNDEIVVMQNRLEEIAKKNTAHDIKVHVEHFQNQLLIQQSNIDKLKHEIKHDEKHITANIDANPVAADHRKSEDHTEERESIESFEKHFNSLRKEFNLFLADKM